MRNIGVSNTGEPLFRFQWNLTVERELPGDMALRVSYVGMNSYRMNLTVDLNQTPPSAQAYDPSQKPYQNWNRILSSENLGYANYQALQTELNRRLKNGLSFQASYTWAKNLANYGGDAPSGFAPEVIYGTAINDYFNLRDVRGNVAGTRRHRFLFSGLYELPFGKGKRFLSNLNPLLNGFFGGWQLSNVTLVQTGPFLTPTFSAGLVDPANIYTFNRGSLMRPDRIGDGQAVLNRFNNVYPEGETALYDAVYLGVEKVSQGTYPKRAIILISDGEDNHSRRSFDELRRKLQEFDGVIYPFGIAGNSHAAKTRVTDNGPFLTDRLASISGGKSFWPVSSEKMNEAFERIALELRRQYSIGYLPSNFVADGKWRRIKILGADPYKFSRLVVRSREGYYAVKNPEDRRDKLGTRH
jgi:hypothetical protein